MKEITVERILARALESLTDTQHLLEKSRFDFAVNRAYYTMYHSIQALLSVKSLRVRSLQKTHAAFYRELILTNKLPRRLEELLKRTFKKSQLADYSYSKMEETDAIEAFADAEFFFNVSVQYLIANNYLK
ncbi:HEPN domain-containing protein [Dyadobacter crusticola]|uniref:HEPN domain-containing protein n=1 Tax=Dyadobacter crusticola TaxID=292407 RepID=UPI0004E13805|nr:HEPN domain-containing protein [Dyadobacter crusticola]